LKSLKGGVPFRKHNYKEVRKEKEKIKDQMGGNFQKKISKKKKKEQSKTNRNRLRRPGGTLVQLRKKIKNKRKG